MRCDCCLRAGYCVVSGDLSGEICILSCEKVSGLE